MVKKFDKRINTLYVIRIVTGYDRNAGKYRFNSNRRKDGQKDMKSNLIKDTTKEERIALIKAWIPDDDGLQDCDMDLWDIYADYINGKREIAEINAEMTGTYYTEEDLR